MWNGRTDAVQSNVDIVVSGNRITSVEPHRDALHRGAVRVDASNETVIPGLIEIHTHLNKDYGEALGRAFLAWGITTVRNPATNAFDTWKTGRRSNPARGSGRASSRQVSRSTARASTIRAERRSTTPVSCRWRCSTREVRIRLHQDLRAASGPDAEANHRRGASNGDAGDLARALSGRGDGADGVEHIRGTSRRGYSPKISGCRARIAMWSIC